MYLKRCGVQPFQICIDGKVLIRRPVQWLCHGGHTRIWNDPDSLNKIDVRPIPFYVTDAVDAGIPLREGRGKALAVYTPTVKRIAERLQVPYHKAREIHRDFMRQLVNLANTS